MAKIENRRRQLQIRRAYKILLLACFAVAGFSLWAWQSSGASRDFAQADDFPRGALVYAQFRDLPALLKVWGESELRKRYLDSENFRQFQNRHLALKLAARWQEFNDALGFKISSDALSGAAENKAAIAVYDIGKMEMVFIAPVADEKIAATMFFQNPENFEPTQLSDDIIYYSREVEADRGRQRQKILFANLKNRFVLATSENLLLRALENIGGKARKDRLSDEPAFADLAKRLDPHLATVWVDQAKLNEDWYFKHYWALRNIAELKALRAGMFDFEMSEDKLIERREFLLAENNDSRDRKITAGESAELKSFVPPDAPFFRLQSINGKPAQAATHLRDAIIDRKPVIEPAKSGGRWIAYDSFAESSNYGDGEDYYYLDSAKFDELIDEDDRTETINDEKRRDNDSEQFENNLRRILSAGQMSAVVNVFRPREREAALFTQFEKAAVFYLNSPEKLDREALEDSLLMISAKDLAVAGERLDVIWNSQNEAKFAWRELKFPALNREICYAARGSALVITNSSELLKTLLIYHETAAPAEKLAEKLSESFDQLSVIRLEQRAPAFDAPMRRLFNEENKHQLQSGKANESADFFTGSVGSLLTATNQAKQIEIKRSAAGRFLSVEVVIALKENPE